MKQEDSEKSMPRRHWLLAGVGVSAGLAGALFAWQKFQPQGVMDEAVQNFWLQEFEKPEGGTLSFQSLRGKPLLVNFWATWCPPCQAPMAHNQEMLEHHSERWGDKVRIIGISIDQGPEVVVKHV